MIYSYIKTVEEGINGTLYTFQAEGSIELGVFDGRHYVFTPTEAPEQLEEINLRVEVFTPELLTNCQYLIDNIRNEGQKQLNAIAEPYQSGERESWYIQVEEAKAGAGAMLEAMATERGITVVEMATKILENNQTYRTAVGEVLGKQQALIDSVKAGELNAWWF